MREMNVQSRRVCHLSKTLICQACIREENFNFNFNPSLKQNPIPKIKVKLNKNRRQTLTIDQPGFLSEGSRRPIGLGHPQVATSLESLKSTLA